MQENCCFKIRSEKKVTNTLLVATANDGILNSVLVPPISRISYSLHSFPNVVIKYCEDSDLRGEGLVCVTVQVHDQL